MTELTCGEMIQADGGRSPFYDLGYLAGDCVEYAWHYYFG